MRRELENLARQDTAVPAHHRGELVLGARAQQCGVQLDGVRALPVGEDEPAVDRAGVRRLGVVEHEGGDRGRKGGQRLTRHGCLLDC